MKLQECDLNIYGVVTRPLIRSEPEREWVLAKESGIIPNSLFDFYCKANYFSFGKAPRFLSDSTRVIFPFVSNLTRGVFDCCLEADELLTQIKTSHEKIYTPIKKIKGSSWDDKANLRLQRTFKYLVVSLSGILDQFAEIAAVFFHPQLPKLNPGRTSFQTFKNFAESPPLVPGIILSVKYPLIQELYTVLKEEIVVAGPEQYWLDLFFLYRNKLAHLGSAMFWSVVFNDDKDNPGIFLPNRWPYFIEQDITTGYGKPEGTIKEFAEKALIHQDVVEYSEMLTGKIKTLIGRGVAVLCKAYAEFNSFDPAPEVISSLQKNTKAFSFQHFK